MVHALGSKGDTIKSSFLHKTPTTHRRETLFVVHSSWSLQGKKTSYFVRLHTAASHQLVIPHTLLARLVIRLISKPVGSLSLIRGTAVPPVRGFVCGGGWGVCVCY